MASGVYKILLGNGYVYYGSSKNLDDRERRHRNMLYNGTHYNIKMQRVFDKYQVFDFVVLEMCNENKLLETEQGLLDEHFGKPTTVNLLPLAGRTLGVKRSPETIERMSASHRGRKLTPEHKEKIAANSRNMSAETRKKIGDASRGRVVSLETRQKLSVSAAGRVWTDESRAKLGASHRGKICPPVTLETRDKLSKAAKAQWARWKHERGVA